MPFSAHESDYARGEIMPHRRNIADECVGFGILLAGLCLGQLLQKMGELFGFRQVHGVTSGCGYCIGETLTPEFDRGWNRSGRRADTQGHWADWRVRCAY